jgi:hypothetical protein
MGELGWGKGREKVVGGKEEGKEASRTGRRRKGKA